MVLSADAHGEAGCVRTYTRTALTDWRDGLVVDGLTLYSMLSLLILERLDTNEA